MNSSGILSASNLKANKISCKISTFQCERISLVKQDLNKVDSTLQAF